MANIPPTTTYIGPSNPKETKTTTEIPAKVTQGQMSVGPYIPVASLYPGGVYNVPGKGPMSIGPGIPPPSGSVQIPPQFVSGGGGGGGGGEAPPPLSTTVTTPEAKQEAAVYEKQATETQKRLEQQQQSWTSEQWRQFNVGKTWLQKEIERAESLPESERIARLKSLFQVKSGELAESLAASSSGVGGGGGQVETPKLTSTEFPTRTTPREQFLKAAGYPPGAVTKDFVPPTNIYGLGGYYVYKDVQGNVIGREQGVVQASTTKPSISEQIMIRREEIKRIPGEITNIPLGIGLGAVSSAISTAKFTKSLLTEPVKTIKSIPSGIKQTAGFVTSGELSRLLREEPAFVTGYAVGEYVTGMGLRKAGKVVWKELKVGTTKLLPSYRAVSLKQSPAVIKEIPSTMEGKKVFDITIAESLKTIETPLSKQVLLAGEKVTAVSAARSFFKAFRREIPIDKPILLGKSPELEKSLFFDPYNRLRVSRLGILQKEKQAGFMDVLYGDISFRRGKPQAIVLEDTKVEAFPAALKEIETKLKTGKGLTISEQSKLLEFELKPSGKLKPIGYLSSEPEVTLPKGEIIQRVKLSARTVILGEPVSIISGRIKTATKETARLLGKEKLSSVEESVLLKRLQKETGFKSYELVSKPYYPPTKPLKSIRYLSSQEPSISKVSREISYRLPSPYKPRKYVSPRLYPSQPSASPFKKSLTYEPLRYKRGYGSPKKYVPPYVPKYPPKYPIYPIKTPTFIPTPKFRLDEPFRQKGKKRRGFDVYKILKGKPVPIMRGVSREAGLDVGVRTALKDLTATTFLRKSSLPLRDISTFGEYKRFGYLFRSPVKTSKYRKLGIDIMIQRQSKIGMGKGRLTTLSERKSIQKARMNKIMNHIK